MMKVLLIGVLLLATGGFAACPCANPAYCNPVPGNTQQKEVVGYRVDSNSDWKNGYDWKRLTTLIIRTQLTDLQLVCYAHQNNVRVVFARGWPYAIPNITDPVARQAFIYETLDMVATNYVDGINMETPYAPNLVVTPDQAVGFLLLTVGLKQALRNYHRGDGQISVTTGTGHGWDFGGLSATADFIVLSEFWPDYGANPPFNIGGQNYCWAVAVAPANESRGEFNRVTAVFNQPDKFVMAWVWEGLSYNCVNPTGPCYFPANGGDAQNPECWYGDAQAKPYSWYVNVLRGTAGYTALTQWEVNQDSFTTANGSYASFWYKEASSGATYQAFVNSPPVMAQHYQWAGQMGLKGVGIWHLDDAVSVQHSSDKYDMYAAVDSFLNTWAPGQVTPAPGRPADITKTGGLVAAIVLLALALVASVAFIIFKVVIKRGSSGDYNAVQ